jgi:hypothetical protein
MNTVHLQGLGTFPGIAAGELKIGQTVVWNFGYESLVSAVEPCGAKSVKVTLFERKSQMVSTRRFLKSRLVAVKGVTQ